MQETSVETAPVQRFASSGRSVRNFLAHKYQNAGYCQLFHRKPKASHAASACPVARWFIRCSILDQFRVVHDIEMENIASRLWNRASIHSSSLFISLSFVFFLLWALFLLLLFLSRISIASAPPQGRSSGSSGDMPMAIGIMPWLKRLYYMFSSPLRDFPVNRSSPAWTRLERAEQGFQPEM